MCKWHNRIWFYSYNEFWTIASTWEWMHRTKKAFLLDQCMCHWLWCSWKKMTGWEEAMITIAFSNWNEGARARAIINMFYIHWMEMFSLLNQWTFITDQHSFWFKEVFFSFYSIRHSPELSVKKNWGNSNSNNSDNSSNGNINGNGERKEEKNKKKKNRQWH